MQIPKLSKLFWNSWLQSHKINCFKKQKQASDHSLTKHCSSRSIRPTEDDVTAKDRWQTVTWHTWIDRGNNALLPSTLNHYTYTMLIFCPIGFRSLLCASLFTFIALEYFTLINVVSHLLFSICLVTTTPTDTMHTLLVSDPNLIFQA
jgi:hypothetical protein